MPGKIIPFRRHARASAGSARKDRLAASSTSKSAVIPASCALGVAKSADHQSSGMRSRCSHFRAVDGGTPMSEAMAPGDFQRPMTSRKDVGRSDMPPVLGQCVLKSKGEMSHDYMGAIRNNPAMVGRMSETEEKLAFIRRVRSARVARYPEGQKNILTILELDQGTYKQYESRTPLPWRFIPKFCAATGVSLEWLLTGEGKGPEVADLPQRKPRRSRGRKTPRAA